MYIIVDDVKIGYFIPKQLRLECLYDIFRFRVIGILIDIKFIGKGLIYRLLSVVILSIVSSKERFYDFYCIPPLLRAV